MKEKKIVSIKESPFLYLPDGFLPPFLQIPSVAYFLSYYLYFFIFSHF